MQRNQASNFIKPNVFALELKRLIAFPRFESRISRGLTIFDPPKEVFIGGVKIAKGISEGFIWNLRKPRLFFLNRMGKL